MKKSRLISIGCLVIICVTACTAGQVQMSELTQMGGGKSTPSETAWPSWTPVPTSTVIPTVEPMVTASPGPAPDLEIINVNFQPSMYSTAFLGEIRNNTDQPVIFPGRLIALRLGIEEWSTDAGIYYSYYKFNALVKPYTDNKTLNCIIYPGEVGILAFDFNICSTKENCVGEGEKLSEPPKQLGYRLLNYESYPKRWYDFLHFPYIKSHYPSELDKGYHLKVDNLTYETQVIEEQMDWGVMFFDFDVAFYMPAYQRGARTPIWIILYDMEGRIVNVMRNSWVQYCGTYGCLESGNTYHISGAACNKTYCLWEDWKKKNPDIQWFEPIAKLTIESMNRVDHIRVLAEDQDDEMCNNTDFDRK
jgi:hypothetical protein